MLVNSTKSSWRPVTRSVSQGSIVGPLLLNVIINGLDYEIECTLSKLADDTKEGRVADTAEDCAPIQRTLNRLEKWPNGNLMKFKIGKYKLLHLIGNNPTHQYMLGTDQLENSFAAKNLRILADTKSNMSQ